MDIDWIAPDACTLPTAAQPLRIAEFDALFNGLVGNVARHEPTQATFRISGSPDIRDRAEELTARESACCSFFTFHVTSLSLTDIDLDVNVPPARVDVLDALVSRANAVRTGAIS